MKISAKYTIEDYKKLDFTSEGDWHVAADILKDRIESRFLTPIAKLKSVNYAGFAIMALDCLLIGTLQQLKREYQEQNGMKVKIILLNF